MLSVHAAPVQCSILWMLLPPNAHPPTLSPFVPPPCLLPQRVLPRCFTEVMLRVINPLRPKFPSWFNNGPKGEHGGESQRVARGLGGRSWNAR